MFIVTVLMFSSLVFAFENEAEKNVDEDPDFEVVSHITNIFFKNNILQEPWSFYDCIWWGLMTLTTVGYHQQPK